MRPWSFLAFGAAIGVSVVVACSTFESSDSGAGADAGDDSANPIDAPIVEGDGGDAGGAVCDDPEPVWVTPASPVPTATCNNVSGINLLNSDEHCGKCNHSCGGDGCSDGNCKQRTEDVNNGRAIVLGWDSQAIYYARGDGNPSTAVRGLQPGTSPTTLYTHAGTNEDTIIESGFVTNDKIFFRTQRALHVIDKQVVTADAGPAFAQLAYDDHGILCQYGDLVLTQNSSVPSIEQIFADGGRGTFLSGTGYAMTCYGDASRLVWLSQPFAVSQPGPSGLHVHSGGSARDLWTIDADIGGLAVSGNSAFVIRRGDAGEIREVDLDDGGGTTLHTDNFHNPATRLVTAVDTTHVYWLRTTDANVGDEVWMRARCGGESVRIFTTGNTYGIVPWLDRIYVFGDDGVVSFHK